MFFNNLLPLGGANHKEQALHLIYAHKKKKKDTKVQHIENPVSIINSISKFDLNLRGDSFLLETAKFIYKTLKVKYVSIARKSSLDSDKVITKIFLKDGEEHKDISYLLKGTPCAEVFHTERVCIYPENAIELFPEDEMLIQENLVGYAGVPIVLPDGSTYGILTILDNDPLQDIEELTILLDFAAARIAVEMAKEIQEQELVEQNKNLEDLVNARTTELHKVIVELEKAQSKIIAQEKLSSVGEISVGMAHEVKNPMNHIVNATEIIEQYFKEDQPKEDADLTVDMIDIIKDSCSRIDKTIMSILEKGEPLPAHSDYKSSNTMMLNLAVKFKSLPEYITLHKEIDEAEIDIPKDEIERILINIIENAKHTLKERSIYSPSGSYIPTLSVIGKIVEDDYIFEIKDNGMGMRDKVRRQIFKPFFTTKQKIKSTGLGLGLVQEVLSKYNSQIEVKSTYGEGTTFTIIIPLAIEKEV